MIEDRWIMSMQYDAPRCYSGAWRHVSTGGGAVGMHQRCRMQGGAETATWESVRPVRRGPRPHVGAGPRKPQQQWWFWMLARPGGAGGEEGRCHVESLMMPRWAVGQSPARRGGPAGHVSVPATSWPRSPAPPSHQHCCFGFLAAVRAIAALTKPGPSVWLLTNVWLPY